MVEIKREDVEAVKLAIKLSMRQDVSVQETLKGSMDFLFQCYGWSKEKDYLYSAMAVLQAYLELGFPYEAYQERFDWLLKEMETCKELQFTFRFYPMAILPLTDRKIKEALGTWSSSKYHTMPIAEVLRDITEKVKGKHIGRYEYHSNVDRRDRTFELLVGKKDSYLHDMQKDLYYLLMEP